MNSVFEELNSRIKSNKSCVLVTIVNKSGEGPQIVGSKMIVDPSGTIYGTIGGGILENKAREKAQDVLAGKKSAMVIYDLNGNKSIPDSDHTGMICGGALSVFFEYIEALPAIYVFGAGHVGKAIVNHLKYLDYAVTVIDHRDGIFAGYESEITTRVGEYNEIIKHLEIADGSYIVIATYAHTFDYTVLKGIYQKNCNPIYIGLLSSKSKVKEIIQNIRNDFPAGCDLHSLYAPVGLDIGGASPDEIAISVIAEIQSLKYDKQNHTNMRETWYL